MKPYLTKSHIEEAILALKRAKESSIDEEINFLEEIKKDLPDGMIEAVVNSQHEMCRILNVGFAESFGNQPSLYFGAGLSSECGEVLKQVIRVIRKNGTKEDMKAAVASELNDVAVYTILLALSHDIDLTKIVNEKCEVIIERAKAGYYSKVK